MRAISKYILQDHMVRKTKKQKTDFIDWLVPQLEKEGYAVAVEQKGSTRNIVVGNVSSAKCIFTAHYDTPAAMPFPNFNTPMNLLTTILVQLLLAAVMLVLVLGVFALATIITRNFFVSYILMLCSIVGVFFLLLAGPANKNNYNDNTSGVVTVMEAALAMPKERRGDVAFVLFDQEEKGLVGSRVFAKAHPEANRKMLVNYDCVSDGDDICFCLTKAVKKQPEKIAALRQSFLPQNGKAVTVVEKGFFFYPSDQAMFKTAASACALKTSKLGVKYLDRIHTKKDTVFDEANIALLAKGSVRLVELL